MRLIRLVLLVYRYGCYKAASLREEQKSSETELLLQQYGKVCIPVPGLWSQKYYNDACKRLKKCRRRLSSQNFVCRIRAT